MINNKQILTSVLLVGAVVAGTVLWAQGSKITSTTSSLNGRFVSIQPPSAGDGTYHNFIWVLDTATGKMNAFRIAQIKDSNGKLDAWITEKLLTDYEYYQLKQQQENK